MTVLLLLRKAPFYSYVLLTYQNIFRIFDMNIFCMKWTDEIIFIQNQLKMAFFIK